MVLVMKGWVQKPVPVEKPKLELGRCMEDMPKVELGSCMGRGESPNTPSWRNAVHSIASCSMEETCAPNAFFPVSVSKGLSQRLSDTQEPTNQVIVLS
jgi:hypothetical protein